MLEAVPVSGRVRNLNVYGHVNKVSLLVQEELWDDSRGFGRCPLNAL